MKLWKLTQNFNRGYETYLAAVVAAESEEEARMTHPDGHLMVRDPHDEQHWWGWALPEHVEVEFLGEAAPGIQSGVILSEFRGG